MKLTIFNAVAFYAGWFACVLGAANGLTWLGPLFVGLHLAVHLAAVTRKRLLDVILIGLSMVIGFMIDSGLSAAGLYTFVTNAPGQPWAPPWMVALWANFAATLHLSMGWLQGRYLLATLFGGLGGPASYLAGERLGAIQLHGAAALFWLVIVWAAVVPALFWLSRDRNHQSPGPQPGGTQSNERDEERSPATVRVRKES